MADRQIDPARLQGEALRRWYLRSPQELEEERRAAAAQRYEDFFGGRRDRDPGFSQSSGTAVRNIDPGFSAGDHVSGDDGDPGFRAMPTGSNDWRVQRAPGRGFQQAGPIAGPNSIDAPSLDRELAGADDGGEFVDVGNPHNRRLKREHIEAYGYWPKTEDGRDYDVAHRRAIADGGTNTLDNIEPMHPDEHRAKHIGDGDPGRWGRRAGIARAFGGKVEPPRPSPKIRGFGGPISPLDVLGTLSGRIRTDSFSNFVSDMVGIPSPEDMDAQRRYIRSLRPPGCPPDMDCV